VTTVCSPPFDKFAAPDHPRMSDTPTFASLLTQWTGDGPAARAGVDAHLRNDPASAAAGEFGNGFERAIGVAEARAG
jgi:hypothetical protein